jgi:gluconate:H+ symporter, GntP family
MRMRGIGRARGMAAALSIVAIFAIQFTSPRTFQGASYLLYGFSVVLMIFTVFFGVFTLASLGLPGLNGFVGEFLVLLGTFRFSGGPLGGLYWGPLAAIGVLEADLGTTLALGVLVSIPVIVVSGPLFGRLAGRWVVVEAPHTFDASPVTDATDARRPSFGITLFSVLLPLVLMLAKAIVDIVINDPENRVQQVFDVIGYPLVALTIAVIVAMFTLGRGAGMDRRGIAKTVEQSLPPIAGIVLIVAAGGGFKQSLIDTGIGTQLAEWAQGSGVSAIVLAWVLAVLIRLATGSATVATITASSLVVDLVADMPAAEVSLVVLAVGAGSVFFSHVNDAGFWLVKEYFGLDVVQTIKSWSLMETVLSVSGLVFVLALSLVI